MDDFTRTLMARPLMPERMMFRRLVYEFSRRYRLRLREAHGYIMTFGEFLGSDAMSDARSWARGELRSIDLELRWPQYPVHRYWTL